MRECECFGTYGDCKEVSPALIGDSEGFQRSIDPPFTGWVCGAMWVSCTSWSARGVVIRSFKLCESLKCFVWSAPFVEEGKLKRESVRVLADKSGRRPSTDVSLPRSDDSV